MPSLDAHILPPTLPGGAGPSAQSPDRSSSDSRLADEQTGRERETGGRQNSDQALGERMLFNEAWLAMALLCVLIGWLTRQSGMVLLGVLLATILPLARLWSNVSLRQIFYSRRLEPRRAFVGETVHLTMTVENHKLLPLGWLEIQDDLPEELHLVDAEQDVSPSLSEGRVNLHNTFSLRWYERVRLYYAVQCPKRGYYRLGPAKIASGDLFGLFCNKSVFPNLDWLIVYPPIIPIAGLGLPPKDPFGVARSEQQLFQDPTRVVGVRDHAPEDGFRRIHWKATARTQSLQAKVYEPTCSVQVMVFVNVATLEKFWMGTIPELLERCIAVAASVCSFGIEQRYVTGLMANGSVPHSDQPIKVLPGRDVQQLTRILEALAAVTPVASSDIADLLADISPHISWGATLVVVTAIVTEELASTLLRLHDVGRRLVLISLDRQPPDAVLSDKVLTYHLPTAAADYYPLPTRAAQQLTNVAQRDTVLATIRRAASGPGDEA